MHWLTKENEMAGETIRRASEIIGEIHVKLKQLGIAPTAELTHWVDNGLPIFIVTVCYHDGFARRHYRVTREAVEAPEFAFQYALEDFWQQIIADMGNKEELINEKK